MNCDGNYSHLEYKRFLQGNICYQEIDHSNHLRTNDNCEHQKMYRQSGNCQKICEHERVEMCRGGCPGGNFNEKNIWEHEGHGPRYDNYGNESNGTGFDVNGSNEPCSRCKSGINVNVVLHQETPATQKNCSLEPKYNVSFKRCCDDNKQRWEPKRRKCLNPVTLTASLLNLAKMKKCKKLESNSCEKTKGNDENGMNFRCTFENCCGNCESYIMELPQNDVNPCPNCRNVEFESGNAYFDDCCCPREIKVYSSNLSVASGSQHEQCCAKHAEKDKCRSNEKKCEYDNKEASKNCLQRVHFAKDNNCARRNYSTCSFCSRKCTPSKASLFVEIGESIADVCDLRSAQIYGDSKESLKSNQEQKEHCDRKNRTDFLKARFRSKKRDSEARCNSSCKGLPSAVTRCYSDRISCMEKCSDDCENMAERSCCGQTMRNAQSSVSCQESYDFRSSANCNKQCETIDRSAWEDRKAKIWSQMQDTYKNLLKIASNSFGQIMKQSNKLKNIKKRSKDCWKAYCEKKAPNEETCWNKLMDESNQCDANYCKNVCCASNQSPNVIEFTECQKPTNQRGK